MGWFSKKPQTPLKLPWRQLESKEALEALFNSPSEVPFLLFKHSTRCGISSFVLSKFESEWNLAEDTCHLYYLDLLQYREISAKIASLSGVVHQSPQLILVHAGNVIYHASHNEIEASVIHKKLIA
jgi:bacillithiol system protein YtxJ